MVREEAFIRKGSSLERALVREEAFARKGHSLEKSSGSRGGVH